MLLPKVPALKFTNPVCMTVVPGDTVRAQADAHRVGDANALGNQVTHEWRELVETADVEEVAVLGHLLTQFLDQLRVFTEERAVIGVRDDVERAEDLVEAVLVRHDHQARLHLETQERIADVGRGLVDVVDDGDDRHPHPSVRETHTAALEDLPGVVDVDVPRLAQVGPERLLEQALESGAAEQACTSSQRRT